MYYRIDIYILDKLSLIGGDHYKTYEEAREIQKLTQKAFSKAKDVRVVIQGFYE